MLRAAHAQPWLPGLWRALSVFLLQNSAAEAGIAATLCKKSAAASLDQVSISQRMKLLDCESHDNVSSRLPCLLTVLFKMRTQA